jgi:hypothetical protein
MMFSIMGQSVMVSIYKQKSGPQLFKKIATEGTESTQTNSVYFLCLLWQKYFTGTFVNSRPVVTTPPFAKPLGHPSFAAQGGEMIRTCRYLFNRNIIRKGTDFSVPFLINYL